ncbi:MAG: DUF3540 domain-containing protein [Polyangiaceae bacterium]|nr:DUF3540 domain-containing protein [Polyangiaceae bacterium]
MIRPRSECAHEVQPVMPRRAEVVSVLDDDTVVVRWHDAPVEALYRAEIAIVDYVAHPEDWVLVTPGTDGLYVVGVLGAARRRARAARVLTLEAKERLVLSAPEIQLRGRTVETNAESATLRASSVEVDADSLVERVRASHRYAEDLAEQRAARARVVVDAGFDVSAGRVSLSAEDDAVLDGARVLLG